MTNIEKYKNAFVEGLEIEMNEVENAVMGEYERWDSIGQMSLIALIEDAFGIEMEPEEVMAFTSYQAGIEILKNHKIEF